MSTHAPYSPSKLPCLALCPRWVSDPTPGPHAVRGAAVHAALAEVVLGRPAPIDLAADIVPLVERGREIWTAYRAEVPEHTWYAEVPLDTLIPGVSGTGDAVAVDEWDDRAILLDWKTGGGERDAADRNLQLAAYAIGVVRRWPHVERVTVVLAELEQDITEAHLDRQRLAAAEREIRAVVERAQAAREGDEVPGERQCKYCARRASCPALQRVAAEVMQRAQQLADAVEQLPAERVGELLAKYREPAALVERFVSALEERAKRLLADGQSVPGWRLDERPGQRRWKVSDGAVLAAVWRWGANHGSGTAGRPEVMVVASPAEVERRLVEWLLRHCGAVLSRDAAKQQVSELLDTITVRDTRAYLVRDEARRKT